MSRPVPDEVLLGLLKAQPAHGYELLDYFRCRDQLGHIWTMSTSQLYAVLKRLEQKDAIVGQEQETKNAPTRVEYKVTDLGNQLLKTWLLNQNPSASVHRIRVLFLSRIFIANLLSIPHDRIIAAQIHACELQMEKFIKQRQEYQSKIQYLTLEFVTQQLDSAINWLKSSQFDLQIHTKKVQSYENEK